MLRSFLALSLLAASPAFAEPARATPLEEVPASLAPAVAKGTAALDALQDRIFKRLHAMMQHAGPVGSVELCRTEAPRAAKEVAAAHGVEIGRTSFRVRNRSNLPRPWAASAVAAAAGKKAADVKPAVFDLGDRLGMLRPIATMPACSRCHGPADAIAPEVKAEIARNYPQDQGTGFAPGDVRGFVWTEVKKR